jgi:hypothetical protein
MRIKADRKITAVAAPEFFKHNITENEMNSTVLYLPTI